jgi:Fic family protein
MRYGHFVSQLQGNMKYNAYIPAALPFKINDYNSVMNEALSGANIAIGKLSSMATAIPDVDFFTFMYVKKESVLSSQIEGTLATFSDLLKAEAEINFGEMHNDVDEIINYISAMNHGLKRLNRLPLSLRLIREMHELLLKGVRGHGRMPGEFRRTQNWVGGVSIQRASYVPPPAHEVMGLLGNLEKYMNEKTGEPELQKAAIIHMQFEAIHPFLDGNGRIGRLLITLYLCAIGLLKKPMLYLSEYFRTHRQEYYDRLQAAHAGDDIEGWLLYFYDAVAETSNTALKTCEKIINIKAVNDDKISAMGRASKNAAALMESLYRKPMVRISDINRITGIKNPNSNLLAEKFVSMGILKEITGRVRNRIFIYKSYVDLFE